MEKFKPAIIFFSIVASIMILFPPIKMGVSDQGYSFIFIISGAKTLYFTKLLIQLFLAGLLSLIVYYTYPLIQNIGLKLLITTMLIFLATSAIYIWYNHSALLLNIFHPNEGQVINLKEKVERDNTQLYILEMKLGMKDTYSIGESLLNDALWVWNALPLPDSSMPDINDYLVDLSKEEIMKRDSINRLAQSVFELQEWKFEEYTLKELLGYNYKLPQGKTVHYEKLEQDLLNIKKKYYGEVFKDLFEYVKFKEQYDNELKEFQEMKDSVRLYVSIILTFILLIILIYKKFRIVKTIENKLLKGRT